MEIYFGKTCVVYENVRNQKGLFVYQGGVGKDGQANFSKKIWKFFQVYEFEEL